MCHSLNMHVSEVPQVNATGPGYTKGRSALSAHMGRAHHAVEHVSKAVQVNGKGKKRRRKPPITAHLGGTRYDIGGCSVGINDYCLSFFIGFYVYSSLKCLQDRCKIKKFYLFIFTLVVPQAAPV